MDNAFFARALMGLSLAFHILFAMAGIAMPLLMVLAERRWRRSGDVHFLDLAKLWTRGTVALFAVGAVSGTVLSFELGLLFPEFMRRAGPVVGWAFAAEGVAFFIEAIFLGVYVYGWERVGPRTHLAAGVVVAVSGAVSGAVVTVANAWMNTPVGFRLEAGQFVEVEPLAILVAPAALHEVVHMLVGAYLGTGLVVAALHAFALLKGRRVGLHRRALGLALAIVVPSALVEPVVGHFAGQEVALEQPAKFAAMEGVERTRARAPLELGPFAIPGLLSFLAFNDADATVVGLDRLAPEERPPTWIGVPFKLMVGLGFWAAALAAWVVWRWARRRPVEEDRSLLRALVVSGPAGFLAVEAGWLVTELGRQPWVIAGALRTAESVTPMPGLVVPFGVFTAVYLGLAAAVILMLRAELLNSLREAP